MNPMKGPRRRAWWICGAFVALMSLFALVSLDSQRRASRTERAIEEVIQDFGFREVTSGYRSLIRTTYMTPLKSEEHGADALKQIKAACRGMKMEVVKQARTTNVFTARDFSNRVTYVKFSADWRDQNEFSDGPDPMIYLTVKRDENRVSFLERLQRLLPW